LFFLLFLSCFLLFIFFFFFHPSCLFSHPWYGIYKGGKGDRELLYPCPVIA
jgi:hypothetical protein